MYNKEKKNKDDFLIMSRRKQAKPRAVISKNDIDEDVQQEQQSQQQNQLVVVEHEQGKQNNNNLTNTKENTTNALGTSSRNSSSSSSSSGSSIKSKSNKDEDINGDNDNNHNDNNCNYDEDDNDNVAIDQNSKDEIDKTTDTIIATMKTELKQKVTNLQNLEKNVVENNEKSQFFNDNHDDVDVYDGNENATKSDELVKRIENEVEDMEIDDGVTEKEQHHSIDIIYPVDDDITMNEDDNSSDSFYSDLYSTHTSSSYSPSMSEGAETPNSLIHHHHHQPHHNSHLHQQQNHPHQDILMNNESGNNGISNRLRRRRQRGGGGIDDGDSDGETIISENGCTINTQHTDSNGDGCVDNEGEMNSNNERIIESSRRYRSTSSSNHHHFNRENKNLRNGGGVDGVNDFNNINNDNDDNNTKDNNGMAADVDDNDDGSNVKKIPIKIRKLDKDLMKSEEKMTGDSIKSGGNGGSNTANSDGSYQCQFCDKSFPRLGYLKKHEQSHAEHLPFKCEYCARLFKHKRSRDRHTKLHTGDRRYRCPHCEAAFSRSDHLKIHMKTHDNQKPFQCTVCNRGYNTAAALTSHMQNHKKQAALLGSGGGGAAAAAAINYSPRSTGSGSSNGSLHKRRYATTTDNSPNRIDYRKHGRNSFISCIYCTKSDFTSLEQLNTHIQSMHENATVKESLLNHSNQNFNAPGFQLSCEYCTMKFPSIPTMFQHMRTTHIDRLTSPNSYFEHFNRLAASGTFSPRLATTANNHRYEETKAKTEQPNPKLESEKVHEEQNSPTDLSQPKRRSQTPLQVQDSSATVPSVASAAVAAIAAAQIEKPGTFLCNQCNAGLPDFDSFRAHLKTHITQGLTNLVCHHCGTTLRDQTEYERHIISHFLLTSSEYSCASSCNKVYTKPDDLQKHLFENHILTVYKCSICSDLFDTKVAIQVHFACIHSTETKIFRCSSCMESFRAEKDFIAHVRTRHSNPSAIQCMFCRAVCSSELEMHFHLAAHARQFRCPACPETFHVEFLLDRHMQTHHSQKDNSANSTPSFHPHYGKTPNNNNNVFDYHAFAAGKNLFQLPTNKFYNPLQIDTNSNKHAALMYGLGQRYFDTSKTLMDMYNNYHQDKVGSNYFIGANTYDSRTNNKQTVENKSNERQQQQQQQQQTLPSSSSSSANGFSCGICERNDFRTETEVHSHRKIVHNLKTGVSLKCAYCSGNFKSRSELEHHMKTCHNSTGKHKCLICDEIFPSPAILAEHKLQHSKVGQSGKCSHCSVTLNDVSAFKSHLSEHNVSEGQIPVQCICCRQTLNSDFEIGLHAKFHTKSTNAPESVCALCLEPIPSTSETRVCEKCCRKHNLNTKFNNLRYDNHHRIHIENRCNLCKMILPNVQRLQEHLIEHTFIGCEERGYSCYICSSVFTVPAGLLSHMNELHGLNSRPYDCNQCTEKFFFRAELDNHLAEHENHNNNNNNSNSNNNNNNINNHHILHHQQQQQHLHQQQQQHHLNSSIGNIVFNKNDNKQEEQQRLENISSNNNGIHHQNKINQHSLQSSLENKLSIHQESAMIEELKAEVKKEAIEENEENDENAVDNVSGTIEAANNIDNVGDGSGSITAVTAATGTSVTTAEDDEEYIEVEKLAEPLASINKNNCNNKDDSKDNN